MKSKVTIIVPVYNTKRYLEECVRSLVAQTYRDIEILLVDDGSNDGSGDLCDTIAAGDERIRVIHKENGGAATARNLGIDEAAGEYVMFIDSDDWLDTDAVESLMQYADENDTDVLRFNYVREFKDRQLVKPNTFLEEKLYVGEECEVVCRQLLGLTGSELRHPESMNFLASCGFNFYKKSLLVKLGVRFVPIQEIGSFVDGLFNFCVFLHVKRFAFINRPFYHYRKTNEGAATANYRKNYVKRQFLLFDKLKEEIVKEGKWERFSEAYHNRIALCTMEICFNAMRNKASFKERYKEIKGVLRHERFRDAYKTLDISKMGLKWRVYYFMIKNSLVLPTYIMTKVVLILKNRGVR
ncbi:MAG: glycosyltransferase [Clostridia bacterium]|nr:glycosyltransferase [Clostridia bacterium]